MFYFKITVRSKGNHGMRRTSRDTYHEFTKPAFAGEYVGTKLVPSNVTSVSVTKISQAAYMRATRTD